MKLKILAEHGVCMVCGKQNPQGMGLTWLVDEAHVIRAFFRLGEAWQGPPGFLHGGASAAILDEALGAAVWNAGYNVAVVSLQMRYRAPLPVDAPLSLEARMTKRDGRKFFAEGTIFLPDGSPAVQAEGVYVLAPHLFEANRYREVTGEFQG